jgi:hypothetical protein
MLEAALVGELAFLWREFGVEDTGRAETFCIRRSPKAAVSVLTSSLLLFIFLVIIVAIIVMRSFGVVVRVRFSDLDGKGTSSGCLDDESSVKSQVNVSCRITSGQLTAIHKSDGRKAYSAFTGAMPLLRPSSRSSGCAESSSNLAFFEGGPSTPSAATASSDGPCLALASKLEALLFTSGCVGAGAESAMTIDGYPR